MNARTSRRVLIVVAVAVVVVAWFFAGFVGLVVAVVGAAAAFVWGPRWVAAGAFAALVVAAIATVAVPMGADSAANSFATDRPVASEAARVAGLLTLVAIVGFALEERDRSGGVDTRPDE